MATITEVNPLDYGAIGNGVHDDTLAFQTILTNHTNIRISKPPVKYKINGTLIVESNTTIVIEKDVLLEVFTSNLFLIQNKENISISGGKVSKLNGQATILVEDSKNITIEDMYTNHNCGENFDKGSNGDAFSFWRSTNVHVTRVKVKDCRSKGIRFTKCTDSSVTFSHFEHIWRSGISIIGGCVGILVADNYVTNCMNKNVYGDGLIDIYGGDGATKEENKNITIERNRIDNFGEEDDSTWELNAGIRVNSTEGARVINNSIKTIKNIHMGIKVTSRGGLTCKNVIVANNHIESTKLVTDGGIKFECVGGNNFFILNNFIDCMNIGGEITTSNAINVEEDGIEKLQIVGNQIKWNMGYGVKFAKTETLRDLVVTDNILDVSRGAFYFKNIEKLIFSNNSVKQGEFTRVEYCKGIMVTGNRMETTLGAALRMKLNENVIVTNNLLNGTSSSSVTGTNILFNNNLTF